jgi:hypothetical protein
MKYIKKFNEGYKNIYDVKWESILPKTLTIIKDGTHTFKIGNIMKNADMVQVTYVNIKSEWGITDTLEFDFYFVKDNDKFRMDIDITWGDLMACEFSITSPNKVDVIEYTSFHSKTDPSNTVFAFKEDDLQSFVDFLNRFDGFKMNRNQFNFLDTDESSYYPK